MLFRSALLNGITWLHADMAEGFLIRKHGLPEIDMSYNPYDIEADEDAQALGIHWIGEENCDD